jgi:glutaredoxin
MAKKEKQAKKAKVEESPLEVYKVGDLMFKCHACGHEHVMQEGITGGVRFDIYTTNKHKLSLACPQCKAVLEVYFAKGNESAIVGVDGQPIPKGPSAELTAEHSSNEPDQPEMAEAELPEEVKAEIEEINNENTVSEESKQEASI